MNATADREAPEAAWARLEKAREWAELTDQQKIFVVVMHATGSAVEAVRAGYRPKSERNERVMSYELQTNPRIAAALAVAAGKEFVPPEKSDARLRRQLHRERKLLLHEICQQIAVADDGSVAKQRLLAQKAAVIREIAESLDPAEIGAKSVSRPQARVGDIVRVDGVPRRVLEIDENGRPTEVSDEPVE